MAFSALSAAWSRSDLPDIAESLADVVLRSLYADLVYVRVRGAGDESVYEAVRTLDELRGRTAREIGEALEPLLQAGAGTAPPAADILGSGRLSLSVVPLGVGGFELLVAGSRQPDFPGPTDKLLLSIAANQAAVVLQHRRAEEALRQSQNLLREADRRKDEFLAILAHELRNPLAPIRNSLEVLRRADGNSLLREKARAMMERQLRQMVRLVDDLLDVSRITRNKLELRKERVELAAAVQSAVETSAPLFQESGHELSVSLPPEPVPLHADPTRLAQVLSNLLNNAAKYTEPGGRVWLTAERRGGEVVVSIRDTGIGIPAAMLPRIFEMFTQVDASLERTHGGLGIGLTLVRRLVELHGGTIQAASAGPGQGSEFTVRLPVLEEPPRDQAPQPAAARSAVAAAAARRRILVVDDNEDAAESLCLLLTLSGNDVHCAHDGLEAVELAVELRPDIVLLDVGLPKLNGYDAARRIREHLGDGVVLIAVTGWGQEEDKRQAREAGFDLHQVKPLDPTLLQELLASLEARR